MHFHKADGQEKQFFMKTKYSIVCLYPKWLILERKLYNKLLVIIFS